MPSTKKTTARPTTDVAAFQDLVMWARRNGIVFNELEVGGVRAVLLDVGARGPAPNTTKGSSDEAARAGLYAQYGGAALERAINETAPPDEEVDEDGEIIESDDDDEE